MRADRVNVFGHAPAYDTGSTLAVTPVTANARGVGSGVSSSIAGDVGPACSHPEFKSNAALSIAPMERARILSRVKEPPSRTAVR
jgi:hypothetical protein